MELSLFNEDCLKVMKDLEDKSIDMILCDLPYYYIDKYRDKEKLKNVRSL